VESVYDTSGNLLGTKAIHTDTVPQIVLGDMQVVQDMGHATQLMDTSRKVHSCFSEQYFKYVVARVDDPVQDGCPLSTLETAARANQSLTDVQKNAAKLNEFKTRSFQ
jgi:hypothetical protein